MTEGLRVACLYSLGCDRLREIQKEESFLKFLRGSEINRNEIEKAVKFLDSFPFYQLIAWQNNICNPFEEKVVRAFWLGNGLLRKIKKEQLAGFFKENKNFPIFLLNKFFTFIGAVPHHNFDVLWTAKLMMENPKVSIGFLIDINNCLIRGGQVCSFEGESLMVHTHRINFLKGRFFLTESKEIIDARLLAENLNVGDFVSIHQGLAREKIEKKTAENIFEITKGALSFFGGK